MSKFDDIDFDRPPEKRTAAPTLNRWDMLSIGVLTLTLCIGLYFLLVFMSPNTPLNPLSENNVFRGLLPTPTATLLQLEPTWTPSATPYIPPTDTPRPTFTPVFTATAFSLVPPTKTPVPTKTPKSPYSVTVQYISSAKYYPELGCNWQGVAGIVLDVNNAHIYGLQLLLTGFWNDQSVNNFMISGTFPLLYGQSGWEFKLGDIPLNSNGTLFLQLRDQGGSVKLSEDVVINTYSDCSKNMVFVKFKKNP
ncbi:MAG: hypothetical protein HFACDABA_01489 [Anaerolineales bacterium]|nr:hypothetical protein [Anaerolineales bacterium]